MSLMWCASKDGDACALISLLSSCLHDIDRPYKRKTPLFVAAERGHVHIIRILIDHGSQAIDTLGDYDMSPIHVAAREGHHLVIEELVQLGSKSLNTQNVKLHTPIMLAAMNDQSTSIETIMRLGCTTIDTPDKFGTPLWYAVRYTIREDNSVRVLKALGADNSTFLRKLSSEEEEKRMNEHIDENYSLDVRYRVYFQRSLSARLFFETKMQK